MKTTILLFLTLLLSAPALAQSNDSLVVLFLSQPGVRPAQIFTDGFESGDLSRWDATADGTADLILQRDDAQGNLLDLRVLDGRTRDLVLEIRDVPTALGFNIGFPPELWGFADPNGDGKRDALFFNEQEVVVGVVDGADFTVWQRGFNPAGGSLRFGVAADLTDDGADELIIYYPDERVVRLWGLEQ